MFLRRAPHSQSLRKDQRGIALLVVLTLVGLLVTMFAVVFINDLVRQNRKQQQTADALAKAKDALIGYAVGRRLDIVVPMPRLGELPCPDINNDGVAGGSCSNGGGTTLGRLPWRTLGIPDLRDGDGERLWYAVSTTFKSNPATPCASPGDPGCLNSDARGTITVRNSDASGSIVVKDGTNPDPFIPSGAVAVIIAPGTVLQRQGAASVQNRSTAGENVAANYLDVGNGEDNANFTDSNPNGFINGPIYDGDRLIVNDSVLPIKYEDIMPLLERRVAGEAMNCLTAYAASSHQRYPWAASVNDSATGDYSSKQNHRFGRVPDSFSETLLGLTLDPLLAPVVNSLCVLPILSSLCMGSAWPGTAAVPACNIATGSWWINWKEQVFFGAAAAYEASAPTVQILPPLITLTVQPPPAPPGDCASAGACMTVNPPSAANKRVVVIVSGRPLTAAAQPAIRDKANATHYLEGLNPGNAPTSPTNFTFQEQTRSATFNDTVLFQ